MKKTVLIPIPRYGFDPTEVSIPWQYLKKAGVTTVFATPDGSIGKADVRMVEGLDLGIFKPLLKAEPSAVKAYRALETSMEFQKPISYKQISNQEFDALFLPGGHDKGMREYLESKILQKTVTQFFEENKPVAAICHGVLLVARSISAKSGKSVLYNRKTTGLTSLQELMAFNLTRMYLGDYYLTYPEITMEDEVKSFLKNKTDFIRGPGYPIPLTRDSEKNQKCGFVLQDENYLSARWPGDAHHFSIELLKLLQNI